MRKAKFIFLLYISLFISIYPTQSRKHRHHHHHIQNEDTIISTSSISRPISRRGSGGHACDPLYRYIFNGCGRWTLPSQPFPNNPSRPRPRRSPPLVPSPPPPVLIPSPPLVPSPPPPVVFPPPLVPSPPPLPPPPTVVLPPLSPTKAGPFFAFVPPAPVDSTHSAGRRNAPTSTLV